MNKLLLDDGTWPPPEQTMLIERSSLSFLKPDSPLSEAIGQTVLIEMRNGKQRQIGIAGMVNDLSRVPTIYSNVIYGYITQDTLFKLDGSRGYNQLHFLVAEKRDEESYVQQVTQQVRDKMEVNGLTIVRKIIPDPGKHPLDGVIQSILLILQVLGVLSLFLSAFLVINSISGIMAQQVEQIGIMKAIGATPAQIMSIYLAIILIFGLLALTLALPLAIFATRAFTRFMATLLNFNLTSFEVPALVFALDLLAGLLVPLLAALIPILNASQMTVTQAIRHTSAKSHHFGVSLLDRLLNQLRGLLPSFLYAIRNIFRHKVRLALTLMSLTLASTIFIAVISVRASLLTTLDQIAGYWQEDIEIGFQREYRLSKVERAMANIPSITQFEGRIKKRGVRLWPDGHESKQNIMIWALSASNEFLKPQILAGRWLLPQDQNAIVINLDFQEEEGDLEIGSQIEIKIEGDEINLQVVGIVTGPLIGGTAFRQPMAYINYPYLARAIGQMGSVNRILIDTTLKRPDIPLFIAKVIEEEFDSYGLQIQTSESYTTRLALLQNQFGTIIILMLIMTILFAVVGGLGLMSMMSLSVLERTKEIGIVRAIGGSNAIVAEIVISEGIFIGLLTWLLGCLFALPLSQFMASMFGLAFIGYPLSHTFPINGILLWLVIIILLSALASYLPIRSALQLSVREMLAHQ
jgi:putative ABC transport system permease protein